MGDRRVWWDVIEARTGEVFAFRWPWLPDERLVTTVRVTFAPAGYGTLLELEDGPFPPTSPGASTLGRRRSGGGARSWPRLRASMDFSVDLRERA